MRTISLSLIAAAMFVSAQARADIILRLPIPVAVTPGNPVRIDFSYLPPHAFAWGVVGFGFTEGGHEIDYPFPTDGLDPGDTIRWQLYDGNDRLVESQTLLWTQPSSLSFSGTGTLCGHPGICFFDPSLTTPTFYVTVSALTGSFSLVSANAFFFPDAVTLRGAIDGQTFANVSIVPGPAAGAGLPGLISVLFGGLCWLRGRRAFNATA